MVKQGEDARRTLFGWKSYGESRTDEQEISADAQ